MTDFTNCPIVPGRAYNGANGSKIAVEYGGGIYMLKFPSSGERKPTNLSYTNSCISEHLASSIFNLIGINAQKTELGTFSIKQLSAYGNQILRHVSVVCQQLLGVFRQTVSAARCQVLDNIFHKFLF